MCFILSHCLKVNEIWSRFSEFFSSNYFFVQYRVNSDGSFNISEVSSNEKLLQVVDEIRNQIIIRRPIFESMFVCT